VPQKYIDTPTCPQSLSLSHFLPLVSGTDYIDSLNSYSSVPSTSDEQALNKIVLLVYNRDLAMVDVPDADQSPRHDCLKQTHSLENIFTPLCLVDTHK